MWDILRGKQIPFCDKYNISVAFFGRRGIQGNQCAGGGFLPLAIPGVGLLRKRSCWQSRWARYWYWTWSQRTWHHAPRSSSRCLLREWLGKPCNQAVRFFSCMISKKFSNLAGKSTGGRIWYIYSVHIRYTASLHWPKYGSDYMNIHANQELHSTIWLSIAALREYDKVKYWDEDMQAEVKDLLVKLEKSIQRERLYYATYRNIQMTDDNSSP